MPRNLARRLWQYFLHLNLYKESTSDIHTAPKEYLATRIYVCSLAIVLLIITIVSALIIRTVHKIEYSPSHTKFSQLVRRYPDTIHCPCSTIGIDYDTFVTTHVRFHQVCSSQFIEQTWIDMVFTEQNNLSLPSDDFRRTLTFFWQVIAGLCDASNRTWTDIVKDFSASHIFNPVAIADDLVKAHVKAILQSYIDSAKTTLTRNLLAIQRVTSGNQMVSALNTNYYLRYPPENSSSADLPQMSPRIYNNCSCLHSQGCPHPATFNDVHGRLITIPGMIGDCLIMDGTLASTFECYYNQSCLSLLHPSLPITIHPLSNNLNIHFIMNSTVEMILNEIMIDEITHDIRFDLYYSQCNASYCSYSYAHRFDILFLISTLIGVFGSVSFALRLIAPLIVTVIFRWKNRRRPMANLIQGVGTQPNRLRIIFNRIRQAIVNLNLFESQRPRTPTNIFREQLLTRLFIFFLAISSIAAGFYTFYVIQNQVVTIEHPSLATYEQLYNDHSDTLQCPCSKLSVPYGTFINVTFILHQICSSDLISSTWLNYLESFDPIFLPDWAVGELARDFRTAGNSYFQLLTTFCTLTKDTIEDVQHLFNNTQFINAYVLDPPVFIEQIQPKIDSYIATTLNDFSAAINWIMITFIDHYFLTGANTNFHIIVGNNDILTIKEPRYYKDARFENGGISVTAPCLCPQQSDYCSTLNLLYTNGSILQQYEQCFDELPIGCSPLTGVLKSTFAWWYNQTYLQNIQATYGRVIDWQHPPNIKPLNKSVSTRFTNEMFEDLVRAMFMELPIRNETHFDRFYSQCAPVSCSYRVLQRRNLIAAFFLFISICSGLYDILHILVRAFGKSIFFLVDWWRNRNIQHAQPLPNAHTKNLLGTIYRSIKNTNLYKTRSIDEIDLRQQRIHTKIYLILFVSCLSVLLFYTAIIERSITKTQAISSIEDYEHLMDLYSDGINCPCTRISIPYKEFVTGLQVDAYHQACSTSLIEASLTKGQDPTPNLDVPNKKDFRYFINVFHHSINQLCTLAKQSVNASIMAFHDSTMFTNQTMPRDRFNNEINATLTRFQQKTPIQFARTLNLIRTTVQGNALIAVYSTNWEIAITEKNKGRNTTFHSMPINYVNAEQNVSCSCAISQACTIPAQLFYENSTPSFTFEGLKLGCYSLETVLRSSLSCFYSKICILMFRQALNIHYLYLFDHYKDSGMLELDSNLTRFNINDTIETLAYEMFIESWTSNVSYERFFNSCAPTYCTYKIYYRFDALELLTTFLSVYSGLSLAIHFMVPYLVKMIKKIRNRFRVVPVQ